MLRLGFFLLLIVSGLSYADNQTNKINGVGSTFAYPIFTKWAESYQQAKKIELNYQPIGSGGGIKQIEAGAVDFGASDAPLTAKQLEEKGLVQFPAIIGGVVIVVNLPKVKPRALTPGKLTLSSSVLANIYLGKIKKWNDPAIVALNSGLTLPAVPITVIHRSDGSGTTFNFTNYLSKASDDWQKAVGQGKVVPWPIGLGGKGNQGVAAYIKRLPGSIGYVEYAYAKTNQLVYTRLKNRAGQFISPNLDSFQAAAKNADWAASQEFHLILTNQPGEKAWPIVASTFVLMPQKPKNPQRAEAVLDFFHWAFDNGQAMAKALDYVPLPESLVKRIALAWQKIHNPQGQPITYLNKQPHGKIPK